MKLPFQVITGLEDATRNFEAIQQTLLDGVTIGSGVPVNPAGHAPSKGNYYFRTDTPTIANQRIYVCTVGGSSPTWVGIV